MATMDELLTPRQLSRIKDAVEQLRFAADEHIAVRVVPAPSWGSGIHGSGPRAQEIATRENLAFYFALGYLKNTYQVDIVYLSSLFNRPDPYFSAYVESCASFYNLKFTAEEHVYLGMITSTGTHFVRLVTVFLDSALELALPAVQSWAQEHLDQARRRFVHIDLGEG